MEAVTKWGKPTYMHAGRNVAMAAGFKHHCGLWFFDGALLSDPLEEATAQFAMPGYAMGLLIFPIGAGIMTNAGLALFLKTSWR